MRRILLGLACSFMGIAGALASSFVPMPAVPAGAVPSTFFGGTFQVGATLTPWVGNIGYMGKTPGTRWVYIQPGTGTLGSGRGVYNWAPLDTAAAMATALGVSHFGYMISDTPGWAVAASQDPVLSAGVSGCPQPVVAKVGNTGNATIAMDPTTPVLAAPAGGAGIYKVIWSSATAFSVYQPNAAFIGSGTNGSTFATQLKFVATAGSTPMVSGDEIDITLYATGAINSTTGQWTTSAPPDAFSDLTTFLTALFTRYPQIDHIFITNEPAAALAGQTCSTLTPAQVVPYNASLVDWMHANYPSVKVGSPTVQPQVPGNMIRAGNWFYDFFNLWTSGGKGATDFDLIQYHGYAGFGFQAGFQGTAQGSEQAFIYGLSTLALEAQFGLTQPIYDEEHSWGPDSNLAIHSTDIGAFVSQDLMLHWAAGNAQHVWYGPWGLAWGTLSTGATPVVLNNGGFAWVQTRSWMLGATLQAPGFNATGGGGYGLLNEVDKLATGTSWWEVASGVRVATWTKPTNNYHAISVWQTSVDNLGTGTYAVPQTDCPLYTQYRSLNPSGLSDTVTPITPFVTKTVPISNLPIWLETTGICNTAYFKGIDSSTIGNWVGVYGSDGFNVSQDNTTTIPSYAVVTLSGQQTSFSQAAPFTWATTTADTRGLQKPENHASRIASAWYGTKPQLIDVNFTDSNPHKVTLYLVDWDSLGRGETITLKDQVTGFVVDTRTIPAFTSGKYVSWDVQGHVVLSVNADAGPNSVVSGIFFDPP